eukprot:5247975-Prymnesium_polylepis.1
MLSSLHPGNGFDGAIESRNGSHARDWAEPAVQPAVPAVHKYGRVDEGRGCATAFGRARAYNTVSYTHLTLPTICSV